MRSSDSGGRRPPAVAAQPHTPLEIACDESGSEGDHLIGAETNVFAYGSVLLDPAAAAACVQEVRDRVGSPALEYKATHLLRGKSRPVLRWLLGRSGPVYGYAHVHITDKAFLVVTKIVELLVEDVAEPGRVGPSPDPAARATAVTLYEEGRACGSRDQWRCFLRSFNVLMRARDRATAEEAGESFCRMAGVLSGTGGTGELGRIIGLLHRRAGARVGRYVARRFDDPDPATTLDPLIAALARTVTYWSRGVRPVSVIHDQQPALTGKWVARINRILTDSSGSPSWSVPGSRLAGLRFVDSRTDPRVQVADFVAGVARKAASDLLRGGGDAELVRLLRPYTDRYSVWSRAGVYPVHADA